MVGGRVWTISVAALCLLPATAAWTLAANEPPTHAEADQGKHVFRKANCFGCHKWHGGGGGGYGGAALSLRDTQLDRDQIIEVVSCGRPGTGMPAHERDAYGDGHCYGLKEQDLGADAPPKAASPLRRSEIEAVADYVIRNIKGRGEVTYAECKSFWGEESKMCNSYTVATPSSNEGMAGSSGPKP
jgi:hypothetical protein